MRFTSLITPFVLVLSLCPGAMLAQFVMTGARVARVEGAVFFDGRSIKESIPIVLKDHSALRTLDGRLEIALPAAGALFLGKDTVVELMARPFNALAFEILRGSVVVITNEWGPAIACEGDVQLSDSGIFRFDVHPVGGQKFCQVRVFKGAAAARLPSFTWVLTSGKTVDLNRRCGDHIQRNTFNAKRVDALDIWSRNHFASDSPQ